MNAESVRGNAACSSRPCERPSQKKLRTQSRLASDMELRGVRLPSTPMLTGLPSVNPTIHPELTNLHLVNTLRRPDIGYK